MVALPSCRGTPAGPVPCQGGGVPSPCAARSAPPAPPGPSALAALLALALLLCCTVVAALPARAAAASTDAEPAWAALRGGGVVVLLRHARTVPGVGDPPGFRLDDCSTQRNLSDAGREQARRLGEAFRAAGVPLGEVLSSRWCRCIDTANEAFGRVAPWPTADSFFDAALATGGPDSRSRQTAELRKRVAAHRGRDVLVVVTHQVNITALTGIYPAMGEAVILRPAPRGAAGGFTIEARLPMP
ncbi:MAG: histidine phosphatase family protein [bacterium]|jgi:phosphohistidine phosphatase SixA|nr:histidine phosphatase family protein [Betaproteobacteria bacterium]